MISASKSVTEIEDVLVSITVQVEDNAAFTGKIHKVTWLVIMIEDSHATLEEELNEVVVESLSDTPTSL